MIEVEVEMAKLRSEIRASEKRFPILTCPPWDVILLIMLEREPQANAADLAEKVAREAQRYENSLGAKGLLAYRTGLREQGRYSEADAVRAYLENQGYEVRDGPKGSSARAGRMARGDQIEVEWAREGK